MIFPRFQFGIDQIEPQLFQAEGNRRFRCQLVDIDALVFSALGQRKLRGDNPVCDAGEGTIFDATH